MLLTILLSFLSVGILGGLLGVGLAFASRALAVGKDQRLEELENVLPGLNCGACGYAGCPAYAAAVSTGDASLTLCGPGGAQTAIDLGRITGRDVGIMATKMVTQVHCRGGRDVSEYTFEYQGLQDCTALHILHEGDKVCKTSCLGLGSCIRVCPADAIDYDNEEKVWVNKDLCISCGKCIEVCPTGVMKWVPYDADYIVACNNFDPPKVVRKHCKVGCIACSICVKRSPEGGYVVEDNLSHIDYSATGDRGAAVEKCPPKCIIQIGDLQVVAAEVESSAPKTESAAVASGQDGDEEN
ncbi:MAG: 4Fe-4S dicluster domain-containing protein [Spirochaetales bacterium]|nr:MAG: 4Fe-4S dicluster domain-containing protein [Spirochaetales bacterium]